MLRACSSRTRVGSGEDLEHRRRAGREVLRERHIVRGYCKNDAAVWAQARWLGAAVSRGQGNVLHIIHTPLAIHGAEVKPQLADELPGEVC